MFHVKEDRRPPSIILQETNDSNCSRPRPPLPWRSGSEHSDRRDHTVLTFSGG
jgi:hypothetical protein